MPKKALLIENDPTIRECIEVMYESEGLEVISASDGRTALALTREHTPDLIVSDLYLAGLNGIDIFEEIRADPQCGAIPFMFITADARDSVRRRCLDLGAEAFLLKPFTFDQLMETTWALLAPTEE